MKNSPLVILLIFFSCFSFSQTCNLKKIAKTLSGKTISEAISYFNLDSTGYSVVQEPYGVIRGIRASKNGVDFLIYCDRETQALDIDTTGGNWIVLPQPSEISLIQDKKII